MSVELLRELALRRNAERRFTLTLCFDDAAADAYRKAVDQLNALEADKQPGDKPPRARSMADKPNQALEAARKRAAEAEQALPPDKTIQVQFAPLTPTAYEALVVKHSDERGQIQFTGFYPQLVTACYAGAYSLAGEDLQLSWQEVLDGCLTGQDYDNCIAGCVSLHRSGQSIPFGQRSSGPAAQS